MDYFDISNYVTHKNDEVSSRYALYAVSNHYGGLGGGHYTAFVKVSSYIIETAKQFTLIRSHAQEKFYLFFLVCLFVFVLKQG